MPIETEQVGDRPKVAAAVTFDFEGKVLDGQRALGKRFGGKWEFIGGKLEDGERLDEALMREHVEETGSEIVVGELLGLSNHDYSDFDGVDIYFFQCRLLGKLDESRIDKSVLKEVRWVPVRDLPDLDWVDGDVKFVEWLVANKGK